MKKVRVFVVDDSALMRKLIPQILEQGDSIEVVGTAMDGHFALKKIEELSPQVVTLDLEMPGLNGIDTLKEVMRRWRLPGRSCLSSPSRIAARSSRSRASSKHPRLLRLGCRWRRATQRWA